VYTTAKRIRAALTPAEKRAFDLHLVSGIFISLLDILFLGVIVWLINITANHQNIVIAGYPISSFVADHLIAVAIAAIALFGIKNLLAYFLTQAQYNYSYRVAARLSNTKLIQYLQSSYFNYIDTDSSVYMYQIGQQPVEFSQYLLSGLQQIIVQTALIVLTVIGILIYNAQLFLLISIFIVPPVLLVAYLIRKQLKTIRSTTRITSEKSLQYLKESLSAYIESYIYNKHTFFANRYIKYQQQLNTNLANLQSIQMLPSRLFEVFAVAGIFIITLINNKQNGNAASLIAVGVFMAAAYKIIPGLVKIISYSGQMKAFDHVLNNMIPGDEIKPENISQTVIDPIKKISFNNIKFSYKDRIVFTNLNLELSAGEFAGISGVSGRGKTTLINMLLGFIDPACGHICINSLQMDMSLLAAYRERISYVKQSVLLLHDTVLKNIVLTDDDYNKDRLNNALQITGLDLLIAQFPEGLNQLVTENGNNLSGGQRQRMMLARALYKDFDLLILDEPFNELDDASEQKILKDLKLLSHQGKMVLFITHNQQSLSFCNKIITIDEA
jgi:ABC-type multidrug transport system fused ATPase/permease subunit